MARQGPHQGAQKSTSTGIGEESTSVDHSASVTMTGAAGTSGAWQRLQVGPCSRRSRATRFLALHFGQRSNESDSGEALGFLTSLAAISLRGAPFRELRCGIPWLGALVWGYLPLPC